MLGPRWAGLSICGTNEQDRTQGQSFLPVSPKPIGGIQCDGRSLNSWLDSGQKPLHLGQFNPGTYSEGPQRSLFQKLPQDKNLAFWGFLGFVNQGW
jgi:hypothetical protein